MNIPPEFEGVGDIFSSEDRHSIWAGLPQGALLLPIFGYMPQDNCSRDTMFRALESRLSSPKLTESVKGKTLTYFNTRYNEKYQCAECYGIWI